MTSHWISPVLHVVLVVGFFALLILGLAWLIRRGQMERREKPLRPRVIIRLLRRRWVGAAALARRDLLGITLAVLAATLLFHVFDLDRALQRLFFVPELLPKPWPMKYQQPWLFLYKEAGAIMILLAVALVGFLVAAYRKPSLRRLRIPLLYGILVLVIGPGILVNFVLKEQWGRPRPSEVTEFGGRWEYHEVLVPGTPGKGKSFPCGHATVGFSLMAGFFVFRRSRPKLARGFLWGGLAAGTLLGIARMAGGGHFASDVMWSGYLVYLVAWALYYLAMTIPYREASPNPNLMAPSATWLGVALAAVAGIAVASVIATPFYREIHRDGQRAGFPHPAPDHLIAEIGRGDVTVHLGMRDTLLIEGVAEGFAPASSEYRDALRFTTNHAGEITADYRVAAQGLFSELDATVDLWLPRGFDGILTLRLDTGDLRILDAGGFAGHAELFLHEGDAILPESWRGRHIATLHLEHGRASYLGDVAARADGNTFPHVY